MRTQRFAWFVIALCGGITLSQTPTPPSAGDGSLGNPYQIATISNLY